MRSWLEEEGEVGADRLQATAGRIERRTRVLESLSTIVDPVQPSGRSPLRQR
jgi:hypothetical protein